ncbi:hypothetical protein AWW66_28525 [Micromonospora rosaria]|uniref:Uncharacterized protein n=1 Tax=Micromonospora rosaria TaxID=47874 RepID=A0A136PJW4_9ACTN|nr:hypothetical protein [Micromonospora rosaria]KXK58651.1 hypothetical protein AWW66_28525 [Micromonospora rosaria]
MEQWPPAGDDALLAELGAALLDSGPVPEEFLDTALAAFSWRTVDAGWTVAELTFDSACDLAPAGALRSGGTDRTLTFHGGPVAMEIEVTRTGIVGQLSTGCDGRVSARTPDGRYEDVPMDAMGYFSMGPLPPGPVQFRARTAEYAMVTTWVLLR